MAAQGSAERFLLLAARQAAALRLVRAAAGRVGKVPVAGAASPHLVEQRARGGVGAFVTRRRGLANRLDVGPNGHFGCLPGRSLTRVIGRSGEIRKVLRPAGGSRRGDQQRRTPTPS